MYAVVLSSGWSCITSPEVWTSAETLDVMVWSSGSWLGMCVGSGTAAHHTFTHLIQFCSWRMKGLFMPLCRWHTLCFRVVHLSGISSDWHKRPLGLQDELVLLWWLKVKGQGHCHFIKQAFGHSSRFCRVIMIKFHTSGSYDKIMKWWQFFYSKGQRSTPHHNVL